MTRIAVVSILALAASAHGAAPGRAVTIYLKQRLGQKGPPGQVAPVLMAVNRSRRRGVSPRVQALDELARGPSASERARGFLVTLPPGTKWRSVAVNRGLATVRLTGTAPDLYGNAAIVYSLTSLSNVGRVRLLLDGRACCVYHHDGRPVRFLTRRTFRRWQGEPCPLRTPPDQVRCRG